VTASRLIFDIAGAVAVVFAAVMVMHRHPIKSLLAIVVSFFAIAVGFVVLSAPFLAAIQIIVYAGAILVLFLFVTMLLNLQTEQEAGARRPFQAALGLVAIVVFAAILLSAVRRSAVPAGLSGRRPASGQIEPLARALFSTAALPFEAVSVLLLASLTGAFVLMRRDKPGSGAP
jgi:NADH-quinone oxidoreductase subunit J